MRVHSVIEITSTETGKSIFVDDGFLGKGYVHSTNPATGTPYTDNIVNTKASESGVSVPDVYDHNGQNTCKRPKGIDDDNPFLLDGKRIDGIP